MKKFNYDTKIKLMALTLPLILYLFFTVFVNETILNIQQAAMLEDSLAQLQNAPQQTLELKQKLKTLEKKAGLSQKLGSLSHQQYLLEIITHYANQNNCVVRNIPTTNIANENGFAIETLVFKIEGNFKNLLQLVYLLEQKYQVGKIGSVEFNTQTDQKTGRRSLDLTLYIQKISKQENES